VETSPPAVADYDPRYLAGVALFNRGEFFDAHDEWESLWTDCPAADRRFYQSLIQAAVALYHWGNGNRAGATRLFHSGRRYMAPYRPTYRGLDVDRFWREVEVALAGALGEPNPPAPFPGREGGASGGEPLPGPLLHFPTAGPTRRAAGEASGPPFPLREGGGGVRLPIAPRILLDPPPEPGDAR